MAQTAKGSEWMRNSGAFNDRALGALARMDNVNSKTLNDTIQGLRDMVDDPNAQLAADQLQAASGFILQDWNRQEFGKGDIRAAAAMEWARQGFADPDDIANVANKIGGASSGYANAFVVQAQLAAMSGGRADFKPGYGVLQSGDGKSFVGATDIEAAYERDASGNIVYETDASGNII